MKYTTQKSEKFVDEIRSIFCLENYSAKNKVGLASWWIVNLDRCFFILPTLSAYDIVIIATVGLRIVSFLVVRNLLLRVFLVLNMPVLFPKVKQNVTSNHIDHLRKYYCSVAGEFLRMVWFPYSRKLSLMMSFAGFSDHDCFIPSLPALQELGPFTNGVYSWMVCRSWLDRSFDCMKTLEGFIVFGIVRICYCSHRNRFRIR